jgi:predicted hydrocarbon binding protein
VTTPALDPSTARTTLTEPMTIDLTGSGMLGITRDALVALRAALMRDGGVGGAAYLQEAGYAGGGSLFEAFRQSLVARGVGAPESLSVEDFQSEATEFFRRAGWGSLQVGALHDMVATLDSEDWAEATPESPLDHVGCSFSSGMFADFFGRVADAPLAVMEVECRSAGSTRCRFLLGSTDVMQSVYDRMSQGYGYDEAVAGAA